MLFAASVSRTIAEPLPEDLSTSGTEPIGAPFQPLTAHEPRNPSWRICALPIDSTWIFNCSDLFLDPSSATATRTLLPYGIPCRNCTRGAANVVSVASL